MTVQNKPRCSTTSATTRDGERGLLEPLGSRLLRTVRDPGVSSASALTTRTLGWYCSSR